MKKPTAFTYRNGNVSEPRGIDICNNSIGEKTFVQACLADKLKSICCAIIKASTALRSTSSHSVYISLYYSFQSRWDYWSTTNNLEFIDPLSSKLDSVLRSFLEEATGLNLLDLGIAEKPLPSLTYDRVELSTKH